MNLPIPVTGFTTLIKVGDTVSAGDVIAKKESTPEQVINLSLALGVQAKEVAQCLKKNPGDSIAMGDVIAQKKGLLRGGDKIVSKIAGIVVRFERNTGELFIRTQDAKAVEEIKAPIDGKVAVCNNEQIVLEITKDVLVGTKGFGRTVEGEIYPLPKKDVVALYDLNPDCIDKIIVGTEFSWDVLVKAFGMGIKGVIASSLHEDVATMLQAKHMSMPIIVVSPDDLQKIVKWHNKKVLLDGEAKAITLLE